MKIAHFVFFGPHQSGLYETTRDMVLAERAIGLDAHMYDTAHAQDDRRPPEEIKFDRGEDILPLSAAHDADIHVMHSIIPKEYLGKKPFVAVLHGAPEYSFYSEILKYKENDRGFSTLLDVYGKQHGVASKFVTLWKRHLPYWQGVFGDDRVEYVPCGITLSEYQVEGEVAKFNPSGNINIGYADSWRSTYFQGPFRIIQGVRQFWKKNPDIKFHLLGIPSAKKREKVWDRYIFAVKHNGDFFGQMFELVPNIADYYRALDLIVTNNSDETRIVREALCCGTRVVAPVGAEFTEFTADVSDPMDLASCIEDCLKEDTLTRAERAEKSRERYDSRHMAEEMKKVFESIV